MVKNTVRILTALALAWAVNTPLAKAAGMGTSGAEFLRLSPGAAPAGMGSAYSALAQDVNASFWNPAGLGGIQNREISFMHLAWIESLNYEYLAFGQPVDSQSGMGANLIYFWVPEFNSTQDEAGIVHDKQSGKMFDLAATLSYGKNLGWQSLMGGNTQIGGSVKIIHRQLMDKTGDAMAADFGIMVQAENQLTAAFTMQNLGTPLKGDPLPTAIRLGLGYPVKVISADHLVRLAADVVKPLDTSDWREMGLKVYFGAEYQLLQTATFRLGYQNGEELSGITAGAGLRYNLLSLDYAFVPYGLLGFTHRVSLSISMPLTDKAKATAEN